MSTFLRTHHEDNGGIRDSLNDFLNAFENFAADPADRATRSVVMQSAEQLVSSFNRADGRLDQIQNGIDTEIQTEVKSFNNRMAELSDLNRQIARIEIAGGDGTAADLRNARQALLEEVAGFAQADFVTVPGSNGQVSVQLRTESGLSVDIVRPGFAPEPLFYNRSSNAFRSSGSSDCGQAS